MNLIPGVISFLSGFLVFLHTTTGAFFPDDTPWTMSAVFDLEHQHPPGYPLYTLLSRTWALLPLGGPSFRLNLLSAVLMSLTGVLVGYISLQISKRYSGSPWTRAISMIASALIFDLSWTGWEQALSFKGGVYALNTLITLGIAGLSTVILGAGMKPTRRLAFLALLIGLGLAHHWMTILVNIPILIIPFIFRRREYLPSPVKALSTLFLAVLGVSIYLLLPIRSGKAYVNWGVPGDVKGFISVVSRAQYRSEERVPPPAGYWGRKARYVAGFFRREWATPGLLLGFAGLTASLTLLPGETLVLFLSALSTAYSVFWYDLKPPDCFFSRAHFYLPTIAIWSAFIGLSLPALFLVKGARLRLILAGAWLVAVLYPAYSRLESHNLSRAYVPYDYSKNLLDSTPPSAFLLCEGEGDWFPCLYQVRVERYRGDVDPLNYYLMRTGYRPFLKAYAMSFPALVKKTGSGYSMDLAGNRPIVASIEMDDPSFARNAPLHGLIRSSFQLSPQRSRQILGRLRHRGVFDVEKTTEMYWTYAVTAVNSGKTPVPGK